LFSLSRRGPAKLAQALRGRNRVDKGLRDEIADERYNRESRSVSRLTGIIAFDGLTS